MIRHCAVDVPSGNAWLVVTLLDVEVIVWSTLNVLEVPPVAAWTPVPCIGIASARVPEIARIAMSNRNRVRLMPSRLLEKCWGQSDQWNHYALCLGLALKGALLYLGGREVRGS